MWQLIKNNSLYFTLFVIFILGGSFYLLSFSKSAGFLIINSHYNPFFDRFFFVLTAFGSGWLYIPFIIFLGLMNLRWSMTLLIAYCLQTIIVQSLKLILFPDIVRPVIWFSDMQAIHTIKGLNNLLYHSFPSGHTATAFSLYTILVFIVLNKYWGLFLFLVAIGVGYSRIYLAQHFPIDVYFGAIIGVLAALTGQWLVQIKLKKRWQWLDHKILGAR
jgi:membrane-associated phospholipid phosphatase